MNGFTIAAVSAGGGQLALCPMPGRHGPYGAALQEVLDWRPRIVITMTPLWELDEEGAATFGADLARAGIGWLHLPVEDFGAPGPDVLAAWPDAARAAVAVLAEGGRVLAHCRGGCGRSGMAVLRIMIEMGEAPETALSRLRQARPCAVETEDQLRWAFAAQPLDSRL